MKIVAVLGILAALGVSSGLAQDKSSGSQMVTEAKEKGDQSSAVISPLAVPPLPKSLEGRWSSRIGVAGQGGNIWSVRIAGQDQSGVINGTVTFWTASCSVRDAPMTGKYDGETLIIESKNPPGTCRYLNFLRFDLKKQNDGSFQGVYEVNQGAGGPGVTERTATLAPVAD